MNWKEIIRTVAESVAEPIVERVGELMDSAWYYELASGVADLIEQKFSVLVRTLFFEPGSGPQEEWAGA